MAKRGKKHVEMTTHPLEVLIEMMINQDMALIIEVKTSRKIKRRKRNTKKTSIVGRKNAEVCFEINRIRSLIKILTQFIIILHLKIKNE